MHCAWNTFQNDTLQVADFWYMPLWLFDIYWMARVYVDVTGMAFLRVFGSMRDLSFWQSNSICGFIGSGQEEMHKECTPVMTLLHEKSRTSTENERTHSWSYMSSIGCDHCFSDPWAVICEFFGGSLIERRSWYFLQIALTAANKTTGWQESMSSSRWVNSFIGYATVEFFLIKHLDRAFEIQLFSRWPRSTLYQCHVDGSTLWETITRYISVLCDMLYTKANFSYIVRSCRIHWDLLRKSSILLALDFS